VSGEVEGIGRISGVQIQSKVTMALTKRVVNFLMQVVGSLGKILATNMHVSCARYVQPLL
jgi:hypothetical protein